MLATKKINIQISDPKNHLYIETFLESMAAEKIASNNTLESYKTDLEQMLTFFDQKKMKIAQIQYNDIMHYIDYLDQSRFSLSSIARKISSMRQFFTFLLSDGVRKDNPTILLSTPKRAQSIPKALSESHIETLLRAACEDVSAEGVRNSTMLEMLYATGMRISELVTLKMQVLKYNKKTNHIANSIFIKGKGNKERMVILSEETISKLVEYLKLRAEFLKKHKQQSNWLFPSSAKDGSITHITRQRFGQVLKQLAIKNNIDPEILSPHKIRHSFATHMLQHGANIKIIQELMGHSSINSTQIYTKICSQITKNAIKQHPLARHNNDQNNNDQNNKN